LRNKAKNATDFTDLGSVKSVAFCIYALQPEAGRKNGVFSLRQFTFCVAGESDHRNINRGLAQPEFQ